jgi:hypothetical protein
MSWIDWPVLARQLLLVIVPVLVSRGLLPEYLADPVVELATYLLGTLLVGYVIYLGQRREQPAAKIEAVAEMPEVKAVKVKDADLADTLGPKVVS